MGGDYGLPQAYSAVAAGNLGVSEHLEPLRLEALRKMFGKEAILKRSPAEANPVEPGPFAHQLRRAG